MIMHKKNMAICGVCAAIAIVVMLMIPVLSPRAHAQTVDTNQQLILKTNILVLETNVVLLMQQQMNAIRKSVIALLQHQVQILQQRVNGQ